MEVASAKFWRSAYLDCTSLVFGECYLHKEDSNGLW